MDAEDSDLVIVLLATPWAGVTRSAGQHRHKELHSGRRRFKASELQLRASDVAHIREACRSCRVSEEQLQCLDVWAQTGSWPSDSQLTVGALLLCKPRAFKHMGDLRDPESFLLWHAWGCPLPHLTKPQWLLFDVVKSCCFVEPLDHRPYANQLKQAEQRTSWTVRLPPEALHQLYDSICLDGNRCDEHFLDWVDWGKQRESSEFTVFTTLAPLVLLASHGRWPVLADMARSSLPTRT